MKRITIWLFCVLLAAPVMWSFAKQEKTETTADPAPDETTEINWMSIDDVQVAMKKQPRKVYMDVYTDWCGWCKVMDKKTFTNPNVIKYMNEHFYAVKLNAETKQSIRFLGKMYEYNTQKGANDFAISLLPEQISYPTSVIFQEYFQGPQPIPGYLDVPKIEMILKYLAEERFKATPFDQWQKDFKPTWN